MTVRFEASFCMHSNTLEARFPITVERVPQLVEYGRIGLYVQSGAPKVEGLCINLNDVARRIKELCCCGLVQLEYDISSKEMRWIGKIQDYPHIPKWIQNLVLGNAKASEICRSQVT